MRVESRPTRSRPSTLDLTEERLGEVSFEDWFETPIFEVDADERLEELATAHRGPLRLAASTLLRVNARAAQLRRHEDDDRSDRVVQADEPPELVEVEPEEATEADIEAWATAPEVEGPSLRSRVSAALDRWAEKEAAGQVRLERIVLPRRWQA